MTLKGFQQLIEDIYFQKDSRRGVEGTFMWFAEEVGELATALREGDKQELRNEFADVLAWLCTLASLAGIDMAEAAGKYANGCPVCSATPCECIEKS